MQIMQIDTAGYWMNTGSDTGGILSGSVQQNAARVSISGSGQRTGNGNSFFIGDLSRKPFDHIEQKRAFAKKQAYQIIKDTYGKERKIDSDLQGRLDHAKTLRSQKGEAKRQIMLLEQQKEELRIQYGVEPDSREQRDIEAVEWLQQPSYDRPSMEELLEAYEVEEKGSHTLYQKLALEADNEEEREALRNQFHVKKDSEEQEMLQTLLWLRDHKESTPSADELVRAEELKKSGNYTEYQTRVLELNSYKEPYERIIQICDYGYLDQAGIGEEYAVVRGTQLERLKKDPMLKASQEAEEILEAASDEIIGMLVDEAKDHIDEKQEEEQERAEEKKEEEKQEQEKIEEVRERREELEELLYPQETEKKHERPQESQVLSGDVLTQDILKMNALHHDVKQEIDNMVQKMNLVAEDLKGIRVDEEI